MKRFWDKVAVKGPDDCWEWQAYRGGAGYGRFGAGRKVFTASRIFWELANGEIPDGLFVCHRCDNPGCVNPGHLFLGTPKQNIDDMCSKGRAKRRHGEAHRDARFTEQQVRDIRANYALCRVSSRELGARYGVSHKAIQRIVNRVTWSHI